MTSETSTKSMEISPNSQTDSTAVTDLGPRTAANGSAKSNGAQATSSSTSTSTAQYSKPVKIAREYYNSEDADNFYALVWGGEDIHVGLYQGNEDTIFDASRRTVRYMASLIEDELDDDARVLDLGAGFGGPARYLASEFGCSVTALNLSEKENKRHRKLNRKRGLDDLIDVVDGSFEDIPAPDARFDLLWSQDAMAHSGQRDVVIQEAERVLKEGGQFIFTDLMQANDCPEDVLEPILERIRLSTLGSPGFYRAVAEEVGLTECFFEDHTHQLVEHYTRVLEETERKEAELTPKISEEYIANMKKGLRHWIEGGEQGHLVWGIFKFEK